MAPDKIFIHRRDISFSEVREDSSDIEYIRKDTVDEIIKTAEDHAYFAGQEKLREKLIKWAKAEKGKCSSETQLYAMFMNTLIKKLNSV